MPHMPRIQIEQQMAQIGIRTTNAKLEINNTPHPKMRIVSERAHMEIEHKAPAFKVQTPQRNIVDRPVISRRQTAQTSASNSKVPTYVPDLVQDGLNTVANTSTAPSTLEVNKAMRHNMAVSQGESLSQSMPNIEWESGYLNITWSSAKMQIEWDQDYMPSFSVEPHSVEIYLREKPYIKITVSDEVIAAMYGPKLDKQV